MESKHLGQSHTNISPLLCVQATAHSCIHVLPEVKKWHLPPFPPGNVDNWVQSITIFLQLAGSTLRWLHLDAKFCMYLTGFVKHSGMEGCSRLSRWWDDVASAQRGSLFACWRKRVARPLAERTDGIYNLDGKHTAQAAFSADVWGSVSCPLLQTIFRH